MPAALSTTHPKCKYSKEKPEGILVHSAEAEDDLGAGWFDHPSQIVAPPAVAVDPVAQRAPKAAAAAKAFKNSETE